MVKELSQLSSFPRKLPLPCPACMYIDGFMKFTYNAVQSIKHFSIIKLN